MKKIKNTDMLKRAFVAIILSISATVSAANITGDKIVAVVGDSVILLSEVNAYTDMKLQQSGGDMLLRNMVFEQALEELITSRILVAHADADTNINVYDYDVSEHVNARINQILAQNKMTREQLAQVLKEQENMTLNEFRNQMSIQIKQEMIQQQVMQHYIVDRDLSREEVRDFYNKYIDSLPSVGESVRLQKIEIQVSGDSLERQKAYETISNIRKQIVERGANFQEMAKTHSKAPNAENDGGDLGFIGKGTLALVRLEAAAFSLDPGEISLPIETRIGWHLLTVSERNSGQVHVYHIFIPVSANEQKLQNAMEILDSVANSNPANELFVEAVEKFSTDQISKAYQGDLEWQLLSALDTQIRSSFQNIAAGITGQPFRKDNTVFLYRISDYNQNRPLDFESDFDEIARFASQLHSQEKLRDLIKSWRENVFIKIYQ